MQGGHSLTPSLPTITQLSGMRDGRMHLPLRINSYRKGPRRLFPTTGKFMNEVVNDTSLYFRLLVSSAKQELFATDTRLLSQCEGQISVIFYRISCPPLETTFLHRSTPFCTR